MRCARCLDVHLITERFQGQIIDACPRCHGVWLPRNDFDQLIARRGPPQRAVPHSCAPEYDQRGYNRSHDSSGRLPAQSRHRPWLSDLFD